MASADLQKFLDELRARISIVDVVGAEGQACPQGTGISGLLSVS